MEKTILKKINELEYHYTLLEEEVKMNYDTRNILNLIKETRELVENLVKKLTIPVVSNSVICCPQCGNERLEETGVGWYICCDKDCDWGDKL